MATAAKKLERTTRLSLRELVDILKSGYTRGCGAGCLHSGAGYPIGQIANEIAAIYVNEGDAEAETALAELLDSGQINARFIALCALNMKIDEISPGTREKMEIFSADPANAEILEAVQQRLAAN